LSSSVETREQPAPSLSERAYAYVRGEIIRGRLGVGSVVAEGRVAEELGISKTPVRQALQTLRREGLLEVGPRRMLIVRGFTDDHKREILQVREALESIALRHACETISIEQIDHLRLLLIRQRRAAERGDEETFVELDETFHLSIAAAAGLWFVERFLNQLRGFVRVMLLGTRRTPEQLLEVHRQHTEIVDLIETRKPARAIKALRAHLEHPDYT